MQPRVRILLGVSAALAVFFAAPASAFVRPTIRLLPDGDTPPVIYSAELRNPQRHNALLEADLVVDADDNDAIARFEYRWNYATYGVIHTTTVDRPRVSYASVRPDTRYALELRAIDTHSNASEWYPVWSGVTPSPPHIIVAGDSIASGYTRQWFMGVATCRDNDLSYGRTIVTELSSMLPERWGPRYSNVAWAGAGVGNMVSGGKDSCGGTHLSQLDQIDLLAADDSWNIVVVTAGINSTNWTDVIVGLTKDTAFSLTERGDQRVCDLALHDKWNIGTRREVITSATSTVTGELGERTNARLFWTGYYDITGTTLALRWTPIGGECQAELDEATAELHSAIRAGLDADTTWVDIDDNITTQSWAGWPHPNATGHETIGTSIAAAITGRWPTADG